MKRKETVCAVVVTYNRKALLLECLEAIRKQTKPADGICIIDNASSDGTPQILMKNRYINELPPLDLDKPWERESEIENLTDGRRIKIYYVHMQENTGSAGGFHEGIKRAYEKGYDWLWLMDDDVEPLPNALETMLEYKEISLCIHASRRFTDGTIFPWEGWLDEGSGFPYQFKVEEFRDKKEWTSVNFGCFEGMLIHNSIIHEIGYPKKELFCYFGCDTYYGYLASKVTNVIYIKAFCFIKKINPSERLTPFHTYLYFRNIVGYLAREISKDKKRYLLFASALILYKSSKFIHRRRPLLIFWMIKGLVDGMRKKWGGERKLLYRKKML